MSNESGSRAHCFPISPFHLLSHLFARLLVLGPPLSLSISSPTLSLYLSLSLHSRHSVLWGLPFVWSSSVVELDELFFLMALPIIRCGVVFVWCAHTCCSKSFDEHVCVQAPRLQSWRMEKESFPNTKQKRSHRENLNSWKI